MTDDDYDALAQKQLASIKRDMRISLEDAAVRATHKVMAELETEKAPMKWLKFDDKGDIIDNTPIYTTPPQRTWVGLTDEDMNNALNYWSDDSRSSYGGAHSANGEYVDMIETWRYIEAKLKEKNT
jgi:hypothetical protein